MGVKPVAKMSALTMGLGALLAGTALASATGASSAAADVQAEPKATAKDNSRRICRNLTPSGSRLTRRVCRTQAQWDDTADTAQEGLLKHQIDQSSLFEQAPGPMGSAGPGPRY